jgi:hypothetical protein
MQLEMLLIIIVHIDVQIFATILLSVNLLYSYKNSVEIKGILSKILVKTLMRAKKIRF